MLPKIGSDDSLVGVGDQESLPKKRLTRGEATKCLLLTRCPAILCCHIQRRYFNPQMERMEKCIQYVEFPEILDLSPFCAYSPIANAQWAAGTQRTSHRDVDPATNGGTRIRYRLQSVIEHSGNAFGGHYVSYRRNQKGEWFRISDSDVVPLPWSRVRRCQAYMLFYEAV